MMRIGPQVLGIAVLTVLLVAALRSESGREVLESPIQTSARRLWIGMTAGEAGSAMPSGMKPALAGSAYSLTAFYHDRQRGESLILSFVRDRPAQTFILPGDEKRLLTMPRYDFRRVRWKLTR
jgi:hypothetical protein